MPVSVNKKPVKDLQLDKAVQDELRSEAISSSMMDNEDNLPRDWKKVRLREISDSIQYGYTESSSLEKVGPKFLRITDIQDNHVNWDNVPFCRIEKEILKKYLLKKGDLVFARTGATVGKSFLIKGEIPEAIFASYLIRVRVNNEADISYISYFFNSGKYWSQITKGQVGIGQPNVNGTKLGRLEIPLPPKPIQQLIVSKIEELFSELDKGIEQLKTAQQQLKVYRQAVLKFAFEGKLINKDLREGQLPDNWTIANVQELVKKEKHAIKAGPFGSSLKKEYYAKKGYKIYGQEQVIKGDAFYGDYYINDEKYIELQSNKIQPLDILISLVGTVGKVLILPENCEPGIINPRLIKISLDRALYLPKFFKYYFESSAVKRLYNSKAQGTTMDVLNLGIIKTIPFPVCSIDEQENIIQEIESRLSVCDKLEETIRQNLNQAEALGQSILKKAFEGKLLSETEVEKTHALTYPIPKEQTLKTAAQPKTIYKKKIKQAQIQFPKVIEGIKTTDLHAGFLAMVIDAHEKSPKHHIKLSHVKGEKIAHLVEAHVGIDLGRVPKKDAAGPDDFPHLKKVEHRAKMANWFGTKKLEIGYTYSSKQGLQKVIARTKGILSGDDLIKIENLITTFLPFDLEESELRATLYAGWNNLLLEGENPSDEEIVYESRENWSKRKLGINRASFFKTLEWMKENGFIPEGKGKKVL